MSTPTIIVGHSRQRSTLEHLVTNGRLAHSMIFAGPSGIGKQLVARELARTLVCAHRTPYGGCGSCQSCTLFDHGNLADIYAIECTGDEERKGLDLDLLRDVLRRLNLTTFSASARVIILNNAEHMSLQAANMLLKTLEEPLKNTYFILVAANPGKLPHTVLSRCQRWFFDGLSDNELEQVLRLTTPDINTDQAALLADGSIENFLSVHKESTRWQELRDELSRITRGDIATAVTLAQSVASSKANLPATLNLMRIVARREMLSASDPRAQRGWAQLLQGLLMAQPLISERNLNAGYLLTNVLVDAARFGQGADFCGSFVEYVT